MNLCWICLFASLSNAQFAFRVEDTDVASIYMDIQAMWEDWAAAGSQVLESASTQGLTDAWAQLASIYGATYVPALYNDAMARNAASALAKEQSTTVWDPNAGDHALYSFSERGISISSAYSGGTYKPHPTAALTTLVTASTESMHPLQTTTAPSSSASSACTRCQFEIYSVLIVAAMLNFALFIHM
ncbi:hypothetical protein GGI23_002107 [Coemansia sp. RSA 2559]|nr:hypothetical protein GGI23_002107 [Coemansia sp. RSA 2559]KAJ2864803.1 hypothetical protein GGI22_001645 [Coemansia erecta]